MVIGLLTFWEISGSFLETVRVNTFLVFSRKFPKKCASGYVPPPQCGIEREGASLFEGIPQGI